MLGGSRRSKMSPSIRDLQLTEVNGRSDDLEDVRLLDSYDEGEDNLAVIEEGMRRIQLRVTGMTCAACSNSVEAALMGLDGVVNASVALLQNRANVTFDPNLLKVSLPFVLYFSTLLLFDKKIDVLCFDCLYLMCQVWWP